MQVMQSVCLVLTDTLYAVGETFSQSKISKHIVNRTTTAPGDRE